MYTFCIHQGITGIELGGLLQHNKVLEVDRMFMGTRRTNGQGYTYKNRTSYRTVLKSHGLVVTASGKTIQESRRNAKTKLAEVAFSSHSSKNDSKITLQNFLSNWLDNEHRHFIAYSTYRRYESLARVHIFPSIGKFMIKEITPKVILQLLNEMRNAGLSARSMQQTRSLLSLTLKAAEDQELILDNPIHKVRNPQNRPKAVESLSIKEVKTLLNTYRDTSMGARLHLALVCGLRQGEALGLCWDDIDFTNLCISIKQQMKYIEGKAQFASLKTLRSARLVMITDETKRALLKHQQLQRIKADHTMGWDENNLVFPGNFGKFVSPKTDYQAWQKALKLCGIPPRRLHDARHTAATLMYSQGVGIETISRALGHSSSAITSRLYVHSAEEPLRRAAEVMNLLLE